MTKYQKTQCHQAHKNESFNMEGQRKRFTEILSELDDVLSFGYANLEQAKSSYDLFRGLLLLRSSLDDLEGKLYEQFDQLENQVERLFFN